MGERKIPAWLPNTVLTDPGQKCQLTQMFQTFSGLHKLQRGGTLCDVIIKVEDASFKAHKVVLAACSEYFTAMFTSGFQESHQSEANINGKSEAFQIMLDFAYSGLLSLSMETVLDVLEMAHYLQFDNVMERCGSFLSTELGNQRVDVVGAIKILSVADTYGLEKLKKGCKQFLAKNFHRSNGFLQHMTPELMEEMLKRTDLTNEKEVFDTTVAWLQHDWLNRKAYAPYLLQRIRLGTVPIGHLSMTIFKSPDLYAIPACKKMIDDVLKLFDGKKPNDPPLHSAYPSLFATRSTVRAFLGIGNNASSYYETRTRKWVLLKKFPQLPDKDCRYAIDSSIIVQGQLYVARGTKDTPRKLKCPQFITLNTAENEWRTLVPMNQRRDDNPLLHLNGLIYAIGGSYDSGCCEVYNINDNRWRPITSMSKPCSVCPTSAAVYEGKILVYAAEEDAINAKVDHHLQMYDPSLDSWFVLMTCKHVLTVATSLLVHDGKCYRIVSGKCECKVGGCKWDEINISELVIDVKNKRVAVGEKQSQALIPTQFKRRAFRINQDVFVICRRKFYKTGIKIARNQVDEVKLDAWKNLQPPYQANVVSFMFDKADWL